MIFLLTTFFLCNAITTQKTYNMRKIINISLPEEIDKKVEEAVKESSFASKSEFFRYLFRRWQENKLLEEIEESRREIREGKGRVLKDVNDLDN